jgi:(R,R)-butanediol dehydrogenase/meso-butanediol dehydrogenase/diacetyl reductase
LRAAVLHGVEDLRLEDVPEPSPGPLDVKVKVSACGICGSDLHLYRGAGLRQSATPQPLVLGHEFSGHIVEVGADVVTRHVGDAVAVRPTVSCGVCGACAAGAENVCRALRFYGVTPPLDGGMSEYAVVPAANVHLLPPGLDVATAALTEPLAVGHHAVGRGAVQKDHTVVVYGAGPIGIGIVLGLRAAGVTGVFLVEPSALRREAAMALGAARDAWDPTTTDIRAEVQRLTDGRGADVVFESSGHPAAFTDAQRVGARQARVVIVAAYETPVDFNPYFLLSTELVLTAALAYTPAEFDEVLLLMASGAYPLDGWVESINLSDVLVGGFDAVSQQRSTKVLVRP